MTPAKLEMGFPHWLNDEDLTLNFSVSTYGVKYLRKVSHAHAASFFLN